MPEGLHEVPELRLPEQAVPIPVCGMEELLRLVENSLCDLDAFGPLWAGALERALERALGSKVTLTKRGKGALRCPLR